MSTAADPLVVIDDSKFGDRGKRVCVECREPTSCLSGALYGPSVVVYTAISRLEAIHQASHRIDEEPA